MRAFDIVVAADLDRGIAKAGELPWHLPGDLAFFRDLTTGPGDNTNAVLMGRKTWDSIPTRFRPLPGRCNIVLSRRHDLDLPDEVGLAHDLDRALDLAEQRAPYGRSFVVGGGAIYAEAILDSRCEQIYLTRIRARFACDTVFPEIPNEFELAESSGTRQAAGTEYEFLRYQRRTT